MRRLAVLLVALGLAAVAAPSAAAAPPPLAFACSSAPTDCSGWFRGPVKLSWDWNDIAASPTAGNCAEQLFSADTPGVRVLCEVTDDASGEYTGLPVTIRVDQTAPAVAPVPERAPDHGGWFNHPVRVGFSGVDATSGVASCTSAVYGGPDGEGIQLAGSCGDVAGNTGTGAFTLAYDATPPAPPGVRVLPGDRTLKLSWPPAAGASAVEVRRITGDGSPALVFSGPGGRFTHRGLRNGRRVRYLVASVDQAGNRAYGRASGVPTSGPLLSPARGARLGAAPRLLWEPVRRARYYNVQLYRDGQKLMTRWPRRPSFQLPELRPGRYLWFVFPGFGERSERRYGRLLGRSGFRIRR